jgi:hypothetical protein
LRLPLHFVGQSKKMRVIHVVAICIAAPVGAGLGAVSGFVAAGFALETLGRGGHADLGIVWVSALVGGCFGLVGAPLLVRRFLRRSKVNHATDL